MTGMCWLDGCRLHTSLHNTYWHIGWTLTWRNEGILVLGWMLKFGFNICSTYLANIQIPYGRNFGWELILSDWQFWEQSANISSTKKLYSVMSFLLQNHSFYVYTRPVARRASPIVGIELNIDSCVQGHMTQRVSDTGGGRRLGLLMRERRSKWRVRSCCKGRPTQRKTIQIKHSNHLYSLESHFISNFVLTEPKPAHGSVKLPACSISHLLCISFELGLAQPPKYNSAKCHNLQHSAKVSSCQNF